MNRPAAGALEAPTVFTNWGNGRGPELVCQALACKPNVLCRFTNEAPCNATIARTVICVLKQGAPCETKRDPLRPSTLVSLVWLSTSDVPSPGTHPLPQDNQNHTLSACCSDLLRWRYRVPEKKLETTKHNITCAAKIYTSRVCRRWLTIKLYVFLSSLFTTKNVNIYIYIWT